MSKIPWDSLFRQLTAITMTILIAKLTVIFNNLTIMWWLIAPAIVAIEEPDRKDDEKHEATTDERHKQ